MTIRLYHDSPTLAFDAEVVGFDGDATRVVLDRTAFYPTSGGQPHDTGSLGGVRVVDVIDDDSRIVHVVDAPLPLGPVQGEIDAARRRDFTVQHTAQHLVSALADDRFGWHTESVHFGNTNSTIEFDAASASDAALAALHEAATEAIAAALPVTTAYEDAAEATGLRKPPPRTGSIRVVTIAGIDRSACGGTHVTSTAQLGSVVWTGVERIRGRVRLGFLAGPRVLRELQRRGEILKRMAQATQGSVDELAELVPRRLASLRDLEGQVQVLQRELAKYRIQELLRDAPPGSGGVRRVVLHPGAASVDALRHLAQEAIAHEQVMLIATVPAAHTVLVACSPDVGMAAGALIKECTKQFGGRGGGSPTIAQAAMPTVEALDRAVEHLFGMPFP